MSVLISSLMQMMEDFNSQYYGHLRENILKSRTYALAEDLESKIVEEFTT